MTYDFWADLTFHYRSKNNANMEPDTVTAETPKQSSGVL